jgi:ABC-type multidrug transport system ATPase subunit
LSAGAVSCHGIARAFHGAPVLRNIDLEAASGDVVSIVGDNGSGKTSLLRIAAGLLTPDAGAVLVAGAPPGSGRAGYLAAGDRAIQHRLTVRQNLEFFAQVSPGGTADAVVPAASMVGMDAHLDTSVGECSTGMRRRVMLACVLVMRPSVLLLDEPLADLDEEGREAVNAVARGWAEMAGCVLATTPTLGESLSDGIAFRLIEGRMEPVS